MVVVRAAATCPARAALGLSHPVSGKARRERVQVMSSRHALGTSSERRLISPIRRRQLSANGAEFAAERCEKTQCKGCEKCADTST